MTKKYLAGLLAVVLTGAAFTGCGKPKTISNSDAEEFVSATTAAPADAGGETAAQDKKAAASSEDTAAETTSGAVETTEAPVVVTDAAGEPVTDAKGEVQTAPPGAEDDQEGDYGTVPSKSETTAAAASPAASEKALHITVETVDVSLDDLKANDYTVPLLISIDKNPGINYSEWGLKLDERCTYTADESGMKYATVSFINDEKHFLWTAWTSGADIKTATGSLLTLYVTVPQDAKPGTTYSVEYADWSLANAAHIWQGGDNDWVSTDQVSWTDGGVVIQ